MCKVRSCKMSLPGRNTESFILTLLFDSKHWLSYDEKVALLVLN